MVLLAGVLLERLTGVAFFQWLAFVGLLLVTITTLDRIGAREIYLLCLSALLTLVVFQLTDTPWLMIQLGLKQGAVLMALIFLLAMLHETASRSPSVIAFGTYLTSQPPGRRFTALFWGANTISVMFNMGIISLMSPLVQRGVEQEALSENQRSVSERRQLSAILRGVSWMVVWSPTAIAPIALLELLDGIDRQRWTLLGLGLTFLVFLIGWLEDYVRFRSSQHTLSVTAPTVNLPWKALLNFLAATLWLVLIIVLVIRVSNESIVFGLMVACPILMFGWLFAQAPEFTASGRENYLGKLHSIVRVRMPEMAPVAVTLACSGFIGRLSAGLVPAEQLAAALGVSLMPQYLLLFSIPVLMIIMSYLALSPIMLAVFFGSLFGALPTLPVDVTLLALSISVGWAMTMTWSPFATVVLLMAKMNNRSGIKLTMGWNWLFNILVLAMYFGVCVWITA